MRLRFRRPARAQAGSRALAILQPYARPGYWNGHQKLGLTLLGLIAFFYGFFFSLTTTFLLVQLSAPLAVLALMVIWLLPQTGKVPTVLLTRLFFTGLLVQFCWPDYLALGLPGMPLITIPRLVTVPMAIIFLICLSQSDTFRGKLKGILDTAPAVWKLILAFSLLALISIVFSETPAVSVNKYVAMMLAWVLSFFVAAWIFAAPGKTRVLTYVILAGVVVMCVIGVWEALAGRVLWAGHLPGFLKPDNPVVDKILGGASRSTTGTHRVQGKFTTPLGFAEMLVYVMPVILHMALTEKRRVLRVLCAVLIPIFLYLIIMADSRLGMVGFSATLLLYLLFWAVERWRRHRDSIFGPAVTLAFPAIAGAFLMATFLIGRLHALVWGTGAHKYSNEGRLGQLAEGLPLVLKHPWGYGIGRGAETLGFTNPAGALSIDNYYLLIALEYGVVGFFVFYGIFAVAIYKGARQILNYEGEEEVFIAPIMIALVNFVIIKAVFSQVEGHGLIFIYVGWLLALLYRIEKRKALRPDAPLPAISDGRHRGRASLPDARKGLPLAKRPTD